MQAGTALRKESDPTIQLKDWNQVQSIPTVCWVWWHTSVILILAKLRQEDHELEATVVYVVRGKGGNYL